MKCRVESKLKKCRLTKVEMVNVVHSRRELVKRSLDALPVRQVVENADFSALHCSATYCTSLRREEKSGVEVS